MKINEASLIFVNILFNMEKQQGSSIISSDPRKVCFCSNSLSNKSCTTRKVPIQAYPGQEFMVSIVTIGQNGTSSRGKVNASLLNEIYPNHTLVSVSHPVLTDKCVNLTYILKSNRNHAQLIFTPETASSYCKIATVTVDLIARIILCPLGFQLTNTAPYVCSCDPFLSKFLMLNLQIKCNINKQTISVPQKAIWFGCFDQEQQNQSSLNCDSLVVTPNCGHYCRNAQGNSTIVEIPLIDLDEQCSDGHTGILCGTCKPEYS